MKEVLSNPTLDCPVHVRTVKPSLKFFSHQKSWLQRFQWHRIAKRFFFFFCKISSSDPFFWYLRSSTYFNRHSFDARGWSWWQYYKERFVWDRFWWSGWLGNMAKLVRWSKRYLKKQKHQLIHLPNHEIVRKFLYHLIWSHLPIEKILFERLDLHNDLICQTFYLSRKNTWMSHCQPSLVKQNVWYVTTEQQVWVK